LADDIAMVNRNSNDGGNKPNLNWYKGCVYTSLQCELKRYEHLKKHLYLSGFGEIFYSTPLQLCSTIDTGDQVEGTPATQNEGGISTIRKYNLEIYIITPEDYYNAVNCMNRMIYECTLHLKDFDHGKKKSVVSEIAAEMKKMFI